MCVGREYTLDLCGRPLLSPTRGGIYIGGGTPKRPGSNRESWCRGRSLMGTGPVLEEWGPSRVDPLKSRGPTPPIRTGSHWGVDLP